MSRSIDCNRRYFAVPIDENLQGRWISVFKTLALLFYIEQNYTKEKRELEPVGLNTVAAKFHFTYPAPSHSTMST